MKRKAEPGDVALLKGSVFEMHEMIYDAEADPGVCVDYGELLLVIAVVRINWTLSNLYVMTPKGFGWIMDNMIDLV